MSMRLQLRVRWGRQRRGIDVLLYTLGGFSFLFWEIIGLEARNRVMVRT